MDKSLNELVNEALFQWVAVTGVDLAATKFSIRLDGKMGSYDIKRATEELNESRELDETGLTTWMMLRGLTEAYMQDQEFTAYDLIFNSGPIKDKLKAMYALHAALENPVVVQALDEFTGKIRAAAERHGFKAMDKLEALLADKYDLAWVRRDALLSMEKLNAHQFTQGDGDKLPIGLNPNLYEIWNVNSLVRALRSQYIPGITVVLVRDPLVLHSFFVLAIKNGDNITILTDKEEEEHPASKRMSRPKAEVRDFERRAGKHWFPYQLLKLEPSEDGKMLYAEARQALVPINTQAVRLSGIEDLSAPQFVWLMLLSELILEKFWKQNYHTPELSYTGEMVVEPHALVGADGTLVKSGMYQPLELPPITKEGVTNESTRPQWHRAPTYWNQWMVDRYDGQVPTEAFNVTGEGQQKLIEASTGLVKLDNFGRLVINRNLESLDPQNFGTKKKIEDDRMWAARYNQMTIIQRCAEEEYDREKKNVEQWLQSAIEKNSEAILTGIARGEFYASVRYEGTPGQDKTRSIWSSEWYLETENILRVAGGKRYPAGYWPQFKIGKYRSEGSRFYCADRPGTIASVFGYMNPNNPEAIAMICGVTVEDLPWALQHWYGDYAPYDGNSILDRLDPIDWVLHNPWREFRISIGASLCKRAYIARRKNLGLTPTSEELVEA